jgi:very-short-patch-repair endonuclease
MKRPPPALFGYPYQGTPTSRLKSDCHEAKLVIELDGSQHYTAEGKMHDTERSAMLEGHGLRVLRYTNADIDNNLSQICDETDRQIK